MCPILSYQNIATLTPVYPIVKNKHYQISSGARASLAEANTLDSFKSKLQS